MKFNSKAIALSFGIMAGLVSIICGLLLLIAPDFAFTLANYFTHGMDLAKISKPATVSGVLTGTIMIIALSYIIAYIFAEIYNRLVKE